MPQHFRYAHRVVGSADEGAGLAWEIVGWSLQRAQRLVDWCKSGRKQQVHPLGFFKIAKRQHAERAHRNAAGQLRGDRVADRAGYEDLSAMTGGQQPRYTIDRRSEVIARALVRLSRMNCHADAQTADRSPVFFGDSPLRLDRGAHGIVRIGKGGAEGIADRFENEAVIRRYAALEDGVVRAQGRLHRLAVRFPPRRAALDIGKEERDGPGGVSLRSHPGFARRLLPSSPLARARFPASFR